jgi:toxin ParE1/3/4
MIRLRVVPEAEAELREAAAWFEQRQEGLGDAFVDSVFQVLERASATPAAFPLQSGAPGVRRGLVQRFSFAVYFQATEGQLTVIAFAHQRRNPATLLESLRRRGGQP